MIISLPHYLTTAMHPSNKEGFITHNTYTNELGASIYGNVLGARIQSKVKINSKIICIVLKKVK